MHNRKPYDGPTKLVIAFDIGTTYSGASYCILERGQVPEILGVNRYPGNPRAKGDAKIPSLLYYDKNGDVKAAGAEALAQMDTQVPDEEEWTLAEWWKLHFRPKHFAHFIDLNDGIPALPPGKSAVDILTDFIKYLFQCTSDYIQQNHPAFAWSSVENPIEYIFTHPNGWEGLPQQLYRRAIVHAGLVPGTREGQSRVHLLSEGEASLHYCVPNLLEMKTTDQPSPQGVVIIDAGGGTIDMSVFSMTFNPISGAETAPAECRLEGSVFVTRRARALLKKKLDGWEHSSEDEISEFTRKFDTSTKLAIKTDQEPSYLQVAGPRYSNRQYNIRNGKLRFSGEEAASLFNDSYNAIIDSFEQQQKYTSTPITTAFFVGGLSTNDWLWSQLQSYFETRNVIICRPDNHINKAVAHGAVLSHIDRDTHLVASRVAHATYGVVCSLSANKSDGEHMQRKGEWEKDPAGDYYVPWYFEPKIRKGDPVGENMVFGESFSLVEYRPTDFGTQTVPLKCYRGTLVDPKWMDQDENDFFPFCDIRVDLSKAAKGLVPNEAAGQVYYKLDYDVIVLFGLTELQAQLCWKTKDGEHRIPATVDFDLGT